MNDGIDTEKEREKLAALEGHTPGPWVTPYDAFKQGWILDTDGDNTQQGIGVAHGQPVAIAGSDSSWKDRLAAANAQLIAAAPDLKATLSSTLDTLDARDAEIERLRKGLKIISKWQWFEIEPHAGDIPDNVNAWARELDEACTQMQRVARAALKPEASDA